MNKGVNDENVAKDGEAASKYLRELAGKFGLCDTGVTFFNFKKANNT